MPISARINGWVEDRRQAWGGALGNFLFSAVAKGITKSLEDMEPGTIEGIKPTLLKIRDNPDCPADLKTLIDKVLTPGNPLIVIVGSLLLLLTMTGILNALMAPVNRAIEYKVDRVVESFRMDPASIITAWRRDPEKYAWLLDDLDEQGWSDEKKEALKIITEFLPSPRDLVEWQAKEVFEPAMVQKYGLSDEFETLDLSLFAKVGVTTEQARNFWIAHWEHPPWLQVVEMMRRGQLTEQDVWDWFRLVEIPPYWRQKLINISWEVPTRVDVRRFWDMRTIDEARLREIYTNLGYHGKDLDDYVLWTKVYGAFPELLTRYKNGWITLDDVKAEVVAMGMSPERAQEMIEEKIKKAAPERIAAEKNLTRTDIFKGIKQGRITRTQGQDLLIDLGYDPDEAAYLLDINIPPDDEDTAVATRQLTKADILSGLKLNIISREEARTKLLELRYSLANTDLLLKIYDAQVAPPVEPKLKEASKADIVLGVKKGVITHEEGYLMLLDIGFSPDASLFILTVQTEESPFSPINFAEFKTLTQLYRKASGLEGPPMNDNIRQAAAEVIRLTGERDALQQSIQREQGFLISDDILPATATARLTLLKTSLRQAEAALSAAKASYNRLIAEKKFV